MSVIGGNDLAFKSSSQKIVQEFEEFEELKNSVRHSLKRRNRAERGLGECLQLCIICMSVER